MPANLKALRELSRIFCVTIPRQIPTNCLRVDELFAHLLYSFTLKNKYKKKKKKTV